MGADETPCAKRRFFDFLSQKRLRLTTQRRVIVDVAFGTRQHFTAEQLLAWSRGIDASVSRATVYRTLPLLVESGLVRALDFGKDRMFYDPNYADSPNHGHLICQDCERIVEFESPKMARLADEIGATLGFKVTAQRLQITGACEELRARGTCKNKPAKPPPSRI